MDNNILRKEGNIWRYDLNELVTYIEDISKNFNGKANLQKFLGAYESFLDNLEERHNIKINYKFNIINKKDPRFKAIYQNYDWCYQKYFIEGLNHDEMAKEAGCSKRVVEKWCCEKHRITSEYRRKFKKLSNIQKDLIIGSLLGDGHIDKRETQPIFIVSHAENQKDYLYWKYDIMKDFCNKEPSYIKPNIREFKNRAYVCQGAYRISSRIQDCFLEFRNMTVIDLIENLSEFSLSIFVLDDGNREKSNWNICLAGLTIDERKRFINVAKSKFNLDIKLTTHDNRYAIVLADSSRELDNIILKNIPNDLDIIQYKILKNKISKPLKRVHIKFNNKNIFLSEFCKSNNLNYKKCHSLLQKNPYLTGEDIINTIRG